MLNYSTVYTGDISPKQQQIVYIPGTNYTYYPNTVPVNWCINGVLVGHDHAVDYREFRRSKSENVLVFTPSRANKSLFTLHQ